MDNDTAILLLLADRQRDIEQLRAEVTNLRAENERLAADAQGLRDAMHQETARLEAESAELRNALAARHRGPEQEEPDDPQEA